MSGGAMRIGAVLEVTRNRKTETTTISSYFEQGSILEAEPYRLNDTLEIRFLGMNIDMEEGGSTAILSTRNPNVVPESSVETLVVEASVKPFISLVWIGSFLAMLGAAIAVVRRRIELTTHPVTLPASTKQTASALKL